MHLCEGGVFHVTEEFLDGAYFRTDSDGNLTESPFSSLFDAFYWAVITVTTVGYGDVCPVSPLGKLLSSICAFIGVLLLAFPVTLISMNFQKAGEFTEKLDELLKIKLDILQEKNNNDNDKMLLNGIEMTSNKDKEINSFNNIEKINSQLVQINEDYNKLIQNFMELKQKSDKEINELLLIIDSKK
jgi:hypothetical protein